MHAENFFMICMSSADFYFSKSFIEILSSISSGCQTVWTQIRPHVAVGELFFPDCNERKKSVFHVNPTDFI